jgi:hypothetical protein
MDEQTETFKPEHLEMLTFAMKRAEAANGAVQCLVDFLASHYKVGPTDTVDWQKGIITRGTPTP